MKLLCVICLYEQIQHAEQKMKRLQQQLHDTRQASVGATAEGDANSKLKLFNCCIVYLNMIKPENLDLKYDNNLRLRTKIC